MSGSKKRLQKSVVPPNLREVVGFASIPVRRVVAELEAQGFRLSLRSAGHWYVYPPDESHSPFGLAVSGRGGHADYIPRDGWKKMRGAGFAWPPPGRELDPDYQAPDISQPLPSPDGLEYKPIKYVEASDEELGLTATEVQQAAYDFRLQEIDYIRFDSYQRHVDKNNPAIANEFSVTKAGCIYISERKNGAIYCFDGQHRIIGAKNAGVKTLPALVYKGLSKADESRLFYVLNRDRKPVSTIQLFKSRVEAKDPLALEIVKRVEENGYVIDFHGNLHENNLMAVRALEVLQRWGVLGRTLTVIQRVWGSDRDALREDVLVGVGAIFKCFGDKVDSRRLISKLANVDIEKIIREVSKQKYEVGGAARTHYARVILKMYNTQLTGRNRLAPFVMPPLPSTRMDEPLAPKA